MKNDSEYKRLIRFVVVLAVILSVVLTGAIFWASFEISNIKHSISERRAEVTEINKADMAKLSTEISKLIVIPAPIKGDKGEDAAPAKDGRDGKDGKDSISTHTVVEKNTIVEKTEPAKNGVDGKDGKTIQLGMSKNGNPIWKYEQDREWQLFEVVEVDL